MKLTKEAVMLGTKRRVDVPVPELVEGGTLTVRPMTEIEAAQYQSACIEGLPASIINAAPKLAKASTPEELQAAGLSWQDIKAAQVCQARATAVAASCGLSCDGVTWTPDEVGALPRGVPERIAARVLEISGMAKESAAMARQFRGDEGGGEPDSDAPAGLPDGADDGRLDADAGDGAAGD